MFAPLVYADSDSDSEIEIDEEEGRSRVGAPPATPAPGVWLPPSLQQREDFVVDIFVNTPSKRQTRAISNILQREFDRHESNTQAASISAAGQRVHLAFEFSMFTTSDIESMVESCRLPPPVFVETKAFLKSAGMYKIHFTTEMNLDSSVEILASGDGGDPEPYNRPRIVTTRYGRRSIRTPGRDDVMEEETEKPFFNRYSNEMPRRKLMAIRRDAIRNRRSRRPPMRGSVLAFK